MKKYIVKALVSCIILSAVILPLQTLNIKALDLNITDGYEKISEKGNLSFYANIETGDFLLKNLKTGKDWFSTQPDTDSDPYSKKNTKDEMSSQITIKYVHKAEQNSNPKEYSKNSIDCSNNGSISVKEIENGIEATYDFSDIGISIPVSYSLFDGYVNVNVDLSEIKETGEGILTEINLLPGFGAESYLSNGYILVPDGSGALINFNNGVSDIYKQRIYGEELNAEKELYNKNYEPIRLPVFGIACENNALLGVITAGDASASLTASSSCDSRGYNSVSSIINTRTISSKVMFAKNWYNKQTVYNLFPAKLPSAEYSVRYYALDNDNAGYVGMAKKYREYLEKEKGLKKQITEPALNIDFIGAIDIKSNFLGITYYKKTPLTTFKQAKDILEELRSEGIERMSVRYIGWENSGVTNQSIPDKAKPLRILGGKKEFNAFKDYLETNGDFFYPVTNLLTFTKGSKRNAIQTPFNETAFQKEFLNSVYAERLDVNKWMLIRPEKISNIFKKYISSYNKLDMKAISLSTLSNTVYSDFSAKNTFYRNDFPALIEDVLKTNDNLILAGEEANAYAVPYLSKIYYAPAYSSGFNCFDEEIPFYQIVLHGYINLTAPSQIQSQNSELNFLKAVESGSELLYLGIEKNSAILRDTAYDKYYSTDYSLWKQDAAEKYKEYMPLLKKVYDQEIISHRTIQENVEETVFANNITVIVNYNSYKVAVNGQELPPTSFIFGG